MPDNAADPLYPESITLAAPDMALIEQAAVLRNVRGVASNFEVDSPETYELVAGDRKEARDLLAKLEAMRVYQKEPALEACRRIDQWFRAPKEWCERFIEACDLGLIRFERIQREQREALERAYAREADERKRALQAEAKKLAADGNAFAAEQLQTVANTVAQPVAVPSAVPKVAGLSSRKTWQVTIKNKADAVAWLMANKLEHCVELNESALTALGRSSEGSMQIPGVEFWQKDSKAQR